MWGLVAYAKRCLRMATVSRDTAKTASASAMSGPAASTSRTSSVNGALPLIERRAQRMRGNRTPQQVERFLATHKALCSEGRN